MSSEEVESKVRTFLKEEFMMDQVEFVSGGDELTLDSLAQAELRLYLSEEFAVNTELDRVGAESFATLNDIVKLVTGESGGRIQ